MYKYSKSSKAKLKTCDPRIQLVMNELIKYVDVSILEGSRSEDMQNYLKAHGNSTLSYPDSKHNKTPFSLAVDVVPYPLDWNDIASFNKLAGMIKLLALQLDVDLHWGGDWKSFVDMPHWELKS